MKSSINVQYNVYAPKAERNHATHLNRVTRTVYPLGSQFKLPRRELTRTDAFTRSREHSAAVRFNEKRLNSAKNTNGSVVVWSLKPNRRYTVCNETFQSTHLHYFPWIYCSNTQCRNVGYSLQLHFITGVKVYNYSKYVWLSYSMCAFILRVFRLFFIQIGYLKNMVLRCYMCGFNCLSWFKCMLLCETNA